MTRREKIEVISEWLNKPTDIKHKKKQENKSEIHKKKVQCSNGPSVLSLTSQTSQK